MEFTDEQKNAIYKKNTNILVAAAAGSGKTAVLVERIIQKILNDGVDIDNLLVVTFTNAAASEMRERVLDAIYKKLDEDKENSEKLERQINLLSKSNICTIHSFCLDVIKNNFFETDISPNFRIASEEEIVLLKQEILDDLFEEKYELEDEKFLKLVDVYTDYKGDEKLKDLILKLFEFSINSVYPEEWLEEKVEMFNVENQKDEDFGKTVWGEILLNSLKEDVIDAEKNLKIVQNKIITYKELSKYIDVLSRDMENLKNLEIAIDTSWNNAFNFFSETVLFETWPRASKEEAEFAIKDEIKDARGKIRDRINKKVKKILIYNSEEAYSDIFAMYEILKNLKDIVLEFSKNFSKEKKEKNIIDFNDIEHYALDILVKKDENGEMVKSEVAKKYTQKFVEVAIDEYQDSNRIQEVILKSVSNGKNTFMVGDVKQSIYKFRRACPELFLEKYEKYSLEGNDEGLKIQLFKNFRSRDSILNLNNNIFESIMSKDLGDIDYNEKEFLNLGAEYDEQDFMKKAEVYIIDNNEEEQEETEIEKENIEDYIDDNSEIEDNLDEELKDISKEELESKFVSQKIKQMIENKVIIQDKKEGKRPIKYRDIVILLRSTKMSDIYEREFLKQGIPVFTDSGSEYLETIEINTIMNLLKIIDNPLDDIALVSVLRSKLFEFTDNEIITIRLFNKKVKFLDSMNIALNNLEDENLKKKIIDFQEKIEKWRSESVYKPLSELIWEIYVETGFYNYVSLMPNGAVRQANLKMLFERAKDYESTSFKGLFNFIRFIEKLKLRSSDLSSAKVIGENEDVVRIMSIHKSKGLEFPVVFLCNVSKQINFKDLTREILFHQDIGIGPEYINYERKIKFSTAAKESIKIKLKREIISEEMRILYVALTRAKEKMIITGVKKNESDNIQKKRESLEAYKKDRKINPILINQYRTYLDWIELTHLNNEILDGENKVFDFNIINSKDVIKEKEEDLNENSNVDFSSYNDFETLENKLNWVYEDNLKTTLPIKSTVSTIKQLESEDIDFETLNKKDIGLANITPKFMEDNKIKASTIGTLTHLVLQKIDLKNINNESDINEFIQELIAKNFMTEEESNKINVSKILSFKNSALGKKIINSKRVYKEQPFCMKVKANRVFEEAKDEEILVQGIIDIFFEDEKGDIILIDYKTDYVAEGEEQKLIDRYKTQLELYTQAIEQSMSKKVAEVYIYSLTLNKEIKI